MTSLKEEFKKDELVKTARQIARKHGWDLVIVIGFKERTYQGSSWGTTKARCELAGKLLHIALNSLLNAFRKPTLH